MAITVDWPIKIITVPRADMTLIQAAPTEIRELNLNQFRLTLKDLEDNPQGMAWLDTHQHNTEVNIGGLTLARVVEIINGYTVTFEDGQYAVNLVGANSNVGDVVNVNQVSVRTQNSAGLISSPDIEYASFNGGVTLDVVNGSAGTVFPQGTPRAPVNNLADAMLIAEYRGFSKIYLHGDLTLGAGDDVEDMMIIGHSPRLNTVTIGAAASTLNCAFESVTVQGTLDGGSEIEFCLVLDLDYVNGYIKSSGLAGEITLAGNESAVLLNCYMPDQDNPPVIDMGGSGQDLSMPNYSGLITIKNHTSPTEEIGIGLDAGAVSLDSSITAGSIIVSGVGRLFDNTTGTATVDSSGLVNKDQLACPTHAIHGSPSYDLSTQVFEFNGQLLLDGERVTCSGATAKLYEAGDQGTVLADLAAGALGTLDVFHWTKTGVTITPGLTYFVRVIFTVASSPTDTVALDLHFTA